MHDKEISFQSWTSSSSWFAEYNTLLEISSGGIKLELYNSMNNCNNDINEFFKRKWREKETPL